MTAFPPVQTIGTPVAPVAVAPGVLATIPYPRSTPNAVPPALPYAVIQNSSPYTLLVSQGGVLTQIAAFTADVVFTNIGDMSGLTVLPQAGASLAIGGQDSTVYTTWYSDRPPGSYPAALGSGTASLSATSEVANFQPFTLAGGAGPPFEQQAVAASTLGWGGIRVALTDLTGNGAGVILKWFASDGSFIGQRMVQAPAGGGGSFVFTTPHLGETVTVIVWSGNNGEQVNLVVSQTSEAIHEWAQLTTAFAVGLGVTDPLINASGVVNSGGAGDRVLGAASWVYAGPVSFYLNGFGAIAAAGFTVSLRSAGTVIGAWTGGGAVNADFPNGNVKVPVWYIPPFPLDVFVQNRSGVNANFSAYVTADDWRG